MLKMKEVSLTIVLSTIFFFLNLLVRFSSHSSCNKVLGSFCKTLLKGKIKKEVSDHLESTTCTSVLCLWCF